MLDGGRCLGADPTQSGLAPVIREAGGVQFLAGCRFYPQALSQLTLPSPDVLFQAINGPPAVVCMLLCEGGERLCQSVLGRHSSFNLLLLLCGRGAQGHSFGGQQFGLVLPPQQG